MSLTCPAPSASGLCFLRCCSWSAACAAFTFSFSIFLFFFFSFSFFFFFSNPALVSRSLVLFSCLPSRFAQENASVARHESARLPRPPLPLLLAHRKHKPNPSPRPTPPPTSSSSNNSPFSRREAQQILFFFLQNQWWDFFFFSVVLLLFTLFFYCSKRKTFMGMIGFLKPKCGRFEKLEGFFFLLWIVTSLSLSAFFVTVFSWEGQAGRRTRHSHLFCKIIRVIITIFFFI